jgi:hypothetical protein
MSKAEISAWPGWSKFIIVIKENYQITWGEGGSRSSNLVQRQGFIYYMKKSIARMGLKTRFQKKKNHMISTLKGTILAR